MISVIFTDTALITEIPETRIKIYTPLDLSKCCYNYRGIQLALNDIREQLQIKWDQASLELVIPLSKIKPWQVNREVFDYIIDYRADSNKLPRNFRHRLPDSIYGVSIRVEIDSDPYCYSI